MRRRIQTFVLSVSISGATLLAVSLFAAVLSAQDEPAGLSNEKTGEVNSPSQGRSGDLEPAPVDVDDPLLKEDSRGLETVLDFVSFEKGVTRLPLYAAAFHSD